MTSVRGPLTTSRREAEVDDVAVLHDVFLAFEADFAVVAAGGHRTARDERIVADDFGADEAARDVAVDLAGGELRRRPARNRPRAAFVLADGEERNVAEQVVAGADDAVEARLREPEIGEERRGVGGIELGDFELDLRADGGGGDRGAPEKPHQPRGGPPGVPPPSAASLRHTAPDH